MSQFEFEVEDVTSSEEESFCSDHLDPKKRKLAEDSDEKEAKKGKIEEEDIDVESESQLDELMHNPNMWHIRNNIFRHLNHDTVEICRKVSNFWNKSLKRMSDVKVLEEFGDRGGQNWDTETKEKVSAIFPGWEKVVKKYAFQAKIEDLQEVGNSLREIRGKDGDMGYFCGYPLHQAAEKGFAKLIEFLQKLTEFVHNTSCHDINDFDANGFSVLQNAIIDGQTDFGLWMILASRELGIDLNADSPYSHGTAFHLACEYGNTEIVQSLISHSKEFNIDLNASCCEGWTAFHEACSKGNAETVQLMISSSKDFSIDLNARTGPDHYGKTAFHYACDSIMCGRRTKRTKTVELIILSSKEFGIDLNAKDSNGKTPFNECCEHGKKEIVQLMIKNSKDFSIDLNARDNDGMSAFYKSCYHGNTETAQLIIENWKDFSIDVNARDSAGMTALHQACDRCYPEMVQLLMQNWKEIGLDINAPNNEGKTAFDLLIPKTEKGAYRARTYRQIKKLMENEYS